MGINWNQAQPAPKAIWTIIHSRIPITTDLGIYNPGHDDHGEGRAVDIGLRANVPTERQLAYDLIRLFRSNAAEVGWSYLIWNKQIWYNDSRGGPLNNGFKGAHTDHIHVSWSQLKSQNTVFPDFTRDLDAYVALGGVADEPTQASYYQPYCQ
jgi:hypothetical protein